MSVDQRDRIDVISTDPVTGNIILDIADHLDWQNSNHAALLRNKVQAYISFVESGQILESYPKSKGQPIIIHVACLHNPTKDGIFLFHEIYRVLNEKGLALPISTRILT